MQLVINNETFEVGIILSNIYTVPMTQKFSMITTSTLKFSW